MKILIFTVMTVCIFSFTATAKEEAKAKYYWRFDLINFGFGYPVNCIDGFELAVVHPEWNLGVGTRVMNVSSAYLSNINWGYVTFITGDRNNQEAIIRLPLYVYYFVKLKKEPVIKMTLESYKGTDSRYLQKITPVVFFAGLKTWQMNEDYRSMLVNFGLEYPLIRWVSIKLGYIHVSHPEYTTDNGQHYDKLNWEGPYVNLCFPMGWGWNTKF